MKQDGIHSTSTGSSWKLQIRGKMAFSEIFWRKGGRPCPFLAVVPRAWHCSHRKQTSQAVICIRFLPSQEELTQVHPSKGSRMVFQQLDHSSSPTFDSTLLNARIAGSCSRTSRASSAILIVTARLQKRAGISLDAQQSPCISLATTFASRPIKFLVSINHCSYRP